MDHLANDSVEELLLEAVQPSCRDQLFSPAVVSNCLAQLLLRLTMANDGLPLTMDP